MKASKGFTLLELLVVMTLLSLLMIGLISALRTMAQTESRIDERFNQLNETRVFNNFLQKILTRVSAAKMDDPAVLGKTRVPLFAYENSLTWAGVMPARPDVGGLHFFRLALESVGDQQALVLRFAPMGPQPLLPDWSSAESRVLLRDVADFQVQAQGLPLPRSESVSNWPKGWQSGWPVTDALPEQVQLAVSKRSGEAVVLTVTVLTLPQGDSSLDPTVIGGSTR
jgi:general secretion pathway protein J